jgi:hypothetical protein
MKSIKIALIAVCFAFALIIEGRSQYRVVSADEGENGYPRWQLQKIGTAKDTIRIPLDTCRMELGFQPAFVVVDTTLYGCNLDFIVQGPGTRGPWFFNFATYAIDGHALRLTESFIYRIPAIKRKDYRNDYEVKIEKTKFILMYTPFTKYGGGVVFDCAYYEQGDGEKLYKRFLAMVKQYAKINPDQKHKNPIDEI